MDARFVSEHQTLMFKVAELAILRRQVKQAQFAVKQGYLSNSRDAEQAYERCIAYIRASVSRL